MPDIREDWDPKKTDRPKHKAAQKEKEKALFKIQLGGSRAWKTETILAELAARNFDPGWFADCLGAMARSGNPRDRIRAMEIIQRFVIHQEGTKIKVGDLDEKSTDELEVAYSDLLVELKKEGVLK